ncbi:MAG: FAD-dependent monooxygenase [Legionellaceae bacterium]|nr:FAD-dependent monooxygenase [Legionellaceae bacterium]
MVKGVEQTVDEIDILIVGGGLIGMAMMCALAPLGYRVRLAEARVAIHNTPQILETRSIALSPASIRILKEIQIWPMLASEASSIRTIHISEQGQFGQAYLNSDDSGEPLGAVVEMHTLNHALKAHLNPTDVYVPARIIGLDAHTGVAELKTESGEQTVRARWIIAADGTHSSVREQLSAQANYKIYPEHAIATNIALSRPHQHVAYERFTSDGPLALLPLDDLHMALVWTLKSEEAEAFKAMSEVKFLQALQRIFGYRAGRFTAVGPRVTYPLQQVMMKKQVHGRVVFVGNAAHTLHPVAGQGFNLGLRDVAMLAECALKEGLTDKSLIHYQALRKSDQKIITTATDGLVSLFKSKLPGIGLARRAGLLALDNSTVLKEMILRHAKGFGGVVPDLVCGIPLDVKTKASGC